MQHGRFYGLEIEVPNFVSNVRNPVIDGVSFTIHDDGSLRMSNPTLGGLSVPPVRTRKGVIYPIGARHTNIGTELVSRPTPLNQLMDALPGVKHLLRKAAYSNLASIHIHVDHRNVPFRDIQRVLTNFIYLERLIFLVSAGGKQHRGESMDNDYRFCRPLTAPIHYMRGETYYPVVDYKGVIRAKNATELCNAWGRWNHNLPHYIPHRLHGISIASLRQGTLEWRVFNATYDKLDSFVRLVDSVHSFSDSDGLVPEKYRRSFHDYRPLPIEDYESMLQTHLPPINEKSCSMIKIPNRIHHYSNTNIGSSLLSFANNVGKEDDGSPDFPLFEGNGNV